MQPDFKVLLMQIITGLRGVDTHCNLLQVSQARTAGLRGGLPVEK
jgi:hypothetical protein